MATPRNAPCPCGSGRKYKKCCLAGDRQQRRGARVPEALTEPVGRARAWLQRADTDDVLETLSELTDLALGGPLEELAFDSTHVANTARTVGLLAPEEERWAAVSAAAAPLITPAWRRRAIDTLGRLLSRPWLSPTIEHRAAVAWLLAKQGEKGAALLGQMIYSAFVAEEFDAQLFDAVGSLLRDGLDGVGRAAPLRRLAERYGVEVVADIVDDVMTGVYRELDLAACAQTLLGPDPPALLTLEEGALLLILLEETGAEGELEQTHLDVEDALFEVLLNDPFERAIEAALEATDAEELRSGLHLALFVRSMDLVSVGRWITNPARRWRVESEAERDLLAAGPIDLATLRDVVDPSDQLRLDGIETAERSLSELGIELGDLRFTDPAHRTLLLLPGRIDWLQVHATGLPAAPLLGGLDLRDPEDRASATRRICHALRSGALLAWEEQLRSEAEGAPPVEQLAGLPRPVGPWYIEVMRLTTSFEPADGDQPGPGWQELDAALEEHTDGLSLPLRLRHGREVIPQWVRDRLPKHREGVTTPQAPGPPDAQLELFD